MRIKEILSKDCIIPNFVATTKEAAIEELASMLALHYPTLQKDDTTRILMEREKLGSTGIGNGVAIPHGKLVTINSIVTGFGRSVPGIEFDSQDGKPAHLFFVLLAPENAASLHLKALARLSRLLKDLHFRTKLLEAKGVAEIYHEIVSEDDKF